MRPSTASLALPPPLPPWSGDRLEKPPGAPLMGKKRFKKILSLGKNLEKDGDTSVWWLFCDCFIYGGFYAIWCSESHEGVYGLGGTGTGEFIRGWALILTRGCVLTLDQTIELERQHGLSRMANVHPRTFYIKNMIYTLYLYIYICMICVYIYIYMCVCVYVYDRYIYIYTYVYICIFTSVSIKASIIPSLDPNHC